MAKVVGFDFGTHQTKICISDNDDPRNVQYEFFEFANADSEEQNFFLPSFVQINEDKTLSYGWAGKKKSLSVANSALDPGMPPKDEGLPKEPDYPLPPTKPEPFTREMALQLIIEANTLRKRQHGKKSKGIPQTDDNINKLVNIKNKKLRQEYSEAYLRWETRTHSLRTSYNRELESTIARNENRRAMYEKALIESKTPKAQVYTNFKYHVFAGQETRNIMSAEQVSLFYIAYIIFLLEDKYGNDFSIQFGVPANPHSYKQLRKLATRLIIRAYQLVEDVFKNDLDRFLASSYEELLSLSDLPDFSEEAKQEYGIMIIPEASACLRSIVSAGRLPEDKLHLLMDIGGGTTDISFFAVNKKKPIIYWFRSIPQGLNFIRESPGNESRYYRIIDDAVTQLKRDLVNDFSETGKPIHYMEDAIKGNIIVYNGGGSSEKQLCKPYGYFSTVRKIADIMPIQFHQPRLLELSHILSNSYGLSNQIDDENTAVKLRPFDQLLRTYKQQVREATVPPAHHSKYEHGLSDFD